MSQHERGRALRARTVLLAGICPFAAMATALAQEPQHDFNIPAGSAADGLQAFAKQSGEQVMFPYAAASGKQTPAISGVMPDSVVLQRLAQAAGLKMTSNVGKTITLQANSAAATQPEPLVGGNVQEITVTARRRAESLSRTPITITALTGQQLIEQGVVDANQLQFVAPSLTVTQGRQGVELNIRGVTTNVTSTKGEPDIAFNIDGAPDLRSEEQALAFFDLQRVEILNGPQSTLYGVASTGGVINLITNAPTSTPAASATAELGNYDTRRLQAMINEPINDIFSVRAAVSTNQREGYVKLTGGSSGNDPADENNVSGRVSLLARFDNDFTILLTQSGGHLGGVGEYSALPMTVTGSGTNLIAHATPTGYSNIFKGEKNDNWYLPTLHVDDAVGPVHVGLISSYNYYREDTTTPDYFESPSFADLPPSVNPQTAGGANNGGRIRIRERFQTYFNELRASNQNPDDRVQYVVGVNYLWQQNNEDGHYFEIYPDARPPVLPAFSTIVEPLNLTTQTSLSAFLHTITAITPKLHLTLGVRQSYDRDSRVGTFAVTEGFGPLWNNTQGTPCVGEQSCVGKDDTGSEKSNALAYNIGLDYRITRAQMVYVSANKGYKPGGFNDPASGLPGGTAPYGPEEILAYEAGYKLSLPYGVRFSTDVYYYDYKAEQIDENVNVSGTIFDIVVLRPTTEYGSESSLTFPITPNDTVNLNAEFEHGWFGRGNGPLTGWALSNIPPWVIGGGYTHVWSLPSGANVKFHADTRWSSAYLEDDIGDFVQFKQPSFSRSDADVAYTSANGKFTTQAFVTNIENKVQITSAGESVTGEANSASATITSPRFWGLRETVKF